MDLATIAHLVEDAAPILAKGIAGGPAGMVIGLIQAAFGATSADSLADKIVSDPDKDTKLRTLEAAHGGEILQVLQASTPLSDQAVASTEDARHMAGATGWRIGMLILLVLAIVATVGMLYITQDNDIRHVLFLVVGALLAELRQVYRLFFGG